MYYVENRTVTLIDLHIKEIFGDNSLNTNTEPNETTTVVMAVHSLEPLLNPN